MGRRLDKSIEDEIVARWEGGCHVLREIAMAVGVYPLTVRRVLDRRGVAVNGHLKYDGRSGSQMRMEYLPTLEEIAEGRRQLQEKWSDRTEMKRRGFRTKKTPYAIPEVHGVDDSGEPTSEYPGGD